MIKNKIVQSHKYLSESILKRFSFQDVNRKYWINYIDLKDMKVKKETTRKFNRESGYYIYENEQKLKTYSEDKIGNLIKKLENNYINNNEVILSKKEINWLINYLAYQWIRDDYVIQSIINNANLHLNVKELKNEIIFNENTDKIFINETKDLDIIINFNKTPKQYILGSGTVTINPNSEDCYIIILVLTSKISVCFSKQGSIKKYLKLKNKYIVREIHNSKTIFNTNLHILNTAILTKSSFVVGRNIELEETLNKYSEIIKQKH